MKAKKRKVRDENSGFGAQKNAPFNTKSPTFQNGWSSCAPACGLGGSALGTVSPEALNSLHPHTCTEIHSSLKSWEHEASFYAKAEAQRGECLPEPTQPAVLAHVCPAAFLGGLEGELAFAVTVPSICPVIPSQNQLPTLPGQSHVAPPDLTWQVGTLGQVGRAEPVAVGGKSHWVLSCAGPSAS